MTDAAMSFTPSARILRLRDLLHAVQ